MGLRTCEIGGNCKKKKQNQKLKSEKTKGNMTCSQQYSCIKISEYH